MSSACGTATALLEREVMIDKLRKEAAMEPDKVVTEAPTKTTQIIAIYGKGGIGKSFTLANLSYMMAQQGKKVLPRRREPSNLPRAAAALRARRGSRSSSAHV